MMRISNAENQAPHQPPDIRAHQVLWPTPDPHTITIGSRRGWTSIWLRKRTLLSFFFVFASMLAALQVLSYFSNKQQGLATTNTGYHYLWT